MPDARYTNQYTNATTREDAQIYEIVQLLRINGARVNRNGTHAFLLRMGSKGRWKEQLFTSQELKARFGQGTMEYAALRSHQRAASVKIAKLKRNPHDAVLA